MNRRRIARTLIAAIAAMAVHATGFAQDATLRFTIWSGNQAHLDMLTGFAESFAETHPGVTVQLDTIPFADYVSKITLQLAGGNPPDIGWLAEAAAPTFIDAGVLSNLAPALKATDGYDFADLSATGLWEVGDALYGVPFSTSPFFVYYNADLFEAAGLETPAALAARGEWTWDAFRAASKAIAEATPADVYGYEQSDGEGYGARLWISITPILRGFGGDAWTADGQCAMNTPASVEAMSFYHSMIFDDRSVVPPGERADFFSGKSGMTITQLSRAANLTNASFAWDVAPMPTGSGGESALVGQAALVVFKNSPNRELATEFLAHVTNQANVTTMAQFFPPARLTVLESPTFLDSNAILSEVQMQVVADGIARGSVVPSHPAFPQIDATARPIFDTLWRADADVAAVMNDVCAGIQPLLR